MIGDYKMANTLTSRNNTRRFPGVKGVRPDNKGVKIAEATERLEAWQALSIKDQLALLDKRPGKSLKQRARLQKLLDKTEAAKVIDEAIEARKEK